VSNLRESDTLRVTERDRVAISDVIDAKYSGVVGCGGRTNRCKGRAESDGGERDGLHTSTPVSHLNHPAGVKESGRGIHDGNVSAAVLRVMFVGSLPSAFIT
jgi:hypothetical protein